MRVLSVTAQKPDSTGSGVYLTELVKGFEKMKIKQAAVVGVNYGDQICLPEGVQVFPVCFGTEEPPFPVVGMSDEMPYRSTRYCDMTEEMTGQFREAFGRRLLEAVSAFRPDVILCHHLYFLAAMTKEMFPEIPVFGISHGSDLRQIKKNEWQREYILSGIPHLNGIFALHQDQKEEISRIYTCPGEQIQVIGTGYNSDIFHIKENKRCRDGGENQKLRLLFAGKISEKKGVKSLLRAMEYLERPKSDISLTLVGGAGNEAEYRAICGLAEVCPVEVEFTGRKTQEELALLMNQSDVFVLPSFYEGLPLVVVEAMACGMKVVCTDLPGILNWLDENIPNHGVVFVEPPAMVNEDEPLEDALPLFERRLAAAIEKACDARMPKRADVERISWLSLCERLAAWMNTEEGNCI